MCCVETDERCATCFAGGFFRAAQNLRGRETKRFAVDVRKAPVSPNGHGPEGRLSVTVSAEGPSLFAAKREKAFSSSFPPSLLSLPQRAFTERLDGQRSTRLRAGHLLQLLKALTHDVSHQDASFFQEVSILHGFPSFRQGVQA